MLVIGGYRSGALFECYNKTYKVIKSGSSLFRLMRNIISAEEIFMYGGLHNFRRLSIAIYRRNLLPPPIVAVKNVIYFSA